jgi:hypothetical protein
MRGGRFGLGVGLAFAAAFAFVIGVLKATGKHIPDEAYSLGFAGSVLASLAAWTLRSSRGPRP